MLLRLFFALPIQKSAERFDWSHSKIYKHKGEKKPLDLSNGLTGRRRRIRCDRLKARQLFAACVLLTNCVVKIVRLRDAFNEISGLHNIKSTQTVCLNLTITLNHDPCEIAIILPEYFFFFLVEVQLFSRYILYTDQDHSQTTKLPLKLLYNLLEINLKLDKKFLLQYHVCRTTGLSSVHTFLPDYLSKSI